MKGNCWAIVPAAGVGKRMGCAVPKQYLDLNGSPILAWTLNRLIDHPQIVGVVVALNSIDEHWPSVRVRLNGSVREVGGGAERCHSVLAGLTYLDDNGQGDEWALVHDAVRPCVRSGDVSSLISQAGGHDVGGILGLPVRDTMKRTDGKTQTITSTVERDDLWHALTPQMFRVRVLKEAIEGVLDSGATATDEAQAMEFAGLQPIVVAGHPDNIKITRPDDLKLAELFLKAQEPSLTSQRHRLAPS